MSGAKLDKLLVTGAEIFCALLLFVIAGLTIAQVVMRYVFNYPFTWSEELSIAAFIYLGFMGIGTAYAKGRHLWVDALVVALPPSIRKVVECLVLGLTSAFLLLVIGLMVKVMIVTTKVGITTAALQLPMAVIYLSLPIGCALFLIQVVKKFWSLGRTP
jgi:TRAP-type C4-dicarboxylate transport system permease small subunit